MAQDASLAPTAGRTRSGAAFNSAVDRVAAFRKARRHTMLVRILRFALPVSAVLMFASYGIFMQRTLSFSWGNNKIEAQGLTFNREALVAHKPRYTGVDKQGSEFEVRAATGEQDLKQKGLVRLESIDGWIRDPNRVQTDLKATRGTFDSNTNVMELYERIDVVSHNGMTADLTRATVYTKESRIVSNEPVIVHMPSGTVRGKAMTIEQKKKQVLFSGGVVANLKPQPKAGAELRPADPAMRSTLGQAAPGRSDAPVDITSSRLLIDDTAKRATFSGNVVAKQTDQVLETAELEVSYEGQPADQPQARQPGMPAAGDAGNRLRRLVSRSDVVLTRGPERATGSAGDFDAINDRAVLMGPVVITAGPDRGATADRAEFDNKADTILLTGQVVVTQHRNVLKGRRLLADRKNATALLSAPVLGGQPKGQISARLYQNENEGAPAKKGAGQPATPSARAPQQGLLAGNARGDPNQPIDIDADTLDIDDKRKTAIFRGKVRAVQGEYVINTEELVASYKGEAGLALGATPAGAAQVPAGQHKSGAQLDKVTSPRKVDIVAKDGQRARGNSAVFDTKANTATLIGDVVLTQGSTVTSGPCALLDMSTGLMRIIDVCGFSATASPAAPAPAGTPAKGAPVTTGRAQVLLYPNQTKEEQKARSKAAGPAAAPAAAGPAAAETAPGATPPAPDQAPPRRPSPRAPREDDSLRPFGFNN